jgi:hypothetical protein
VNKFDPFLISSLSMKQIERDILESFMWPLNVAEPKVHYEGGETFTEVKYAIKANDGMRGFGGEPDNQDYISLIQTLEDAHLYDFADDAADAIEARRPLGGTRELSIVPVRVTTTTERVKVVTTETPAKTVYRIRPDFNQKVFATWDAKLQGLSWGTSGKVPTDFATANDAADAIARRNKAWTPRDFSIVPVTTPRDVKVEKTTVAPASSSRSL